VLDEERQKLKFTKIKVSLHSANPGSITEPWGNKIPDKVEVAFP